MRKEGSRNYQTPIDRPHDTLHDKKGTLIMRTHKRFVLLGSLLLAAGLLIAFTPTASTASAATNSHTTSNLAATTPASSIRLAQVVHVSVTSTVLTASRTSAGVSCRTFTSYLSFSYLGVNSLWLKIQTYYCWNYLIVTYHSTTLYWGVTAGGAGNGWGWLYNPYYAFNCYVSTSSWRSCSGNHEHAKEIFINPFLRSEAALIIDQEENYKGQDFNQFSSYICPGGC
jgi:hypothetical protein